MLGLGFDQLVDVLNRLGSQAIRVNAQQCSKLRHRRSSCSLCADCCPTQAITWGEALQVDPDKCTGCGICAAVCPTGALEARAPTNLQLLAQVQEGLREGTAIAFACTRYLESRDGGSACFIPVHCLGRLDESVLVGAVCLGAEALWLMDAACQDSQSEEAKGPKKGELPVRLPLKRQVLLAALKGIGKPAVASFEADGGPFGPAQGRLWAQFGFEEACTGCQMCAFSCPTGALSKIEEGGKAGVAFRISFCTNCRLCQDICYKQVVLLAPGVDLSQILSDAVDTFLMRDVDATPWSTNRF
jgi:ferredoxin